MALRTLPSVTVSGANTATKLVATATRAHTVIIQAAAGNATVVWVGDKNVSSTPGSERGFSVAAGTAQTVQEESSANGYDISEIYFASTSATAKVYPSFNEA